MLAPVSWLIQVTEYQLPGVGPPAAKPPSSFKTSLVSTQSHGFWACPAPPPPVAPPGPPPPEPTLEAPTVMVWPRPSPPRTVFACEAVGTTLTAASPTRNTATAERHRVRNLTYPHTCLPPVSSGSVASTRYWSTPSTTCRPRNPLDPARPQRADRWPRKPLSVARRRTLGRSLAPLPAQSQWEFRSRSVHDRLRRRLASARRRTVSPPIAVREWWQPVPARWHRRSPPHPGTPVRRRATPRAPLDLPPTPVIREHRMQSPGARCCGPIQAQGFPAPPACPSSCTHSKGLGTWPRPTSATALSTSFEGGHRGLDCPSDVDHKSCP